MISHIFEPTGIMPVAAIATARRHSATSPIYGRTVAHLAEVSRSVRQHATSSAPAPAPGVRHISPRTLPAHRSSSWNAL